MLTTIENRAPIDSWRFRVGAAIRLGDMAAIVLSRSRSQAGREIYSVWVMGNSYGRPYRCVLGESVVMENPACG